MTFVLDKHRIRRYVSPASRDLLGYAPEELTGVSPIGMVHPDDVARVAEVYDALFAGRERAGLTNRIRHRDGHWIWVEAALRLVRDPVTGAPSQISGALRDITARVAAQTALRESEERYRLLLQSVAVEALYMLDGEGNIQSWNAGAERIKGYSADEVLGRNFAIFFTPEDVARGEPARILAIARDTGRFAADGWRVRKDGTHFLADIVIEAMRNPDGSLRGFAKVARDITEQRIEEQQRAIIIEAAPNGMMIVDEDGNISLVNSQLEQIFGYAHGTLVGQSVETLVPEAFRVSHEVERSKFTAGADVRGMAQGREFTGRKRDGGDY